jgi:RHS repeat-associated protein
VRVAGDPSATTFTYDAGKNLTRIVAPHPEEISCSPGAEQPGCRVLALKYPNEGPNARLEWVSYTAFDPDEGSTGAMVPKKVVEYTYDTAGNLTKVTDPRTGLSTSYTYAKGDIDNVIRLTEITPSGLDRYTLDYRGGGTAEAPFTDGLVSVKRGSTYTNAYAYNLDVTNANLPTMTGSQVAKWGQQVAPTNVFAAFGQDSASQAVTALSADVLKKADLSYTDNDGRVINTASYTGAEGGHWNLTATDFDGSGNVIRELDERGIAQVLDAVADGIEVSADEYATITRYNSDITAPSEITVADKKYEAGDVITAAGTLVTDVWAPVREIVAHDGTVSLGRQHMRTTYDQGAPNGGYNPETGLPFRLATTMRVTLAEPDTATSDPLIPPVAGEPVLSEQRLGYDPIDGASTVGKTSGWIVGAPTVSTTENGSADITTKTVYDVQGRAVKEIGADSNGSDAGTTVTHYYDAGEPAGTPAACRNTAKWAGMACQTTTGEATPTVPVTTTTKYSYYLAPQITTEELGGVKRTTTTTFDSAGRVETSVTSVTGMTGSTAQPKTRNVYSLTTGLQLETQTVDANNVTLKSVQTGYDGWGRATRYTDQDGKTSTTTYDSAGRVATEISAKDNVVTRYTYEPYSGAVTKKNVTGIGDFTATYDRFGSIASQALPTGVTQTFTYDRTGQETSLSYTVTGPEGEAGYGWTMDHDALGRIHQVTGPSSEGGTRVSSYGFDMAARMITAGDQIDEQCTSRTYGFDTVGRRTSLKTATSTCGGSATTTTKTWTYDKADRILKGANSTGDYVYDKLGRQTSLPAIDTPAGSSAGNLTISYYDSDLARTVTQNGVATTYNLDVMDRRSTSTTTNSAGTSTTTRYYEDTSDNPAWATTTTGGTTETSRYVSSIAGDLSVTQNVSTKSLSTGIIDPQGSVVSTSYTHTPEVENGQVAAPVTMWSALESFDEYGNTLAVSQDKITGALNYSWLGGKERATDLSGLVLMGVRLYNSVTGQFTSVDPVKGGNTTAYAYPQDPINQYDLSGMMAALALAGIAFPHIAFAALLAVVGTVLITIAAQAVWKGTKWAVQTVRAKYYAKKPSKTHGGHAGKRQGKRSISDDMIAQTIRTGKKSKGNKKGTTKYRTKSIWVVTNSQTGYVISVGWN